MISWIQITFQRHFRVIFLALLAVLIVSFVFTIGAAPGIGGADRQVQARTFFDLNLSNPEDQTTLYRDAELSIYLQAGYQNIPQGQLQEFALQRYASLYLAKQLNLPAPTEAQLKEFIQSVRIFTGQDGNFDASAYTSFRDNLKLGSGFTEADVNRVLQDDYRVRRVNTLLSGPGYVDENEVAFQLARTDTVWTTEIARVDYTSFAPTIEPTDDELQAYFDANAFRFETPAMVQVSYVEFPATSYLAQIELTDDQIRAFYESNPARFPKPASAEGESETPMVGAESLDADFQAVRDQVSAALRYERARRMSAEAASDLTVEIYDAQLKTDAIAPFLASKGLTLRDAPAFSRNAPPAFLGGSPQAAAAAFNLSASRTVSDAIPTAAGAVVMIWKSSIPPAPSLYINVADAVRADFVENEKRQSFVALGQSLRQTLQTAVAAGTPFADAVENLTSTAGATIKTETYSDFSRREPPQDFPYAASNSLESLKAGEVSEMVISGNEGLITYAAAKTAPVTDESNPRFEELRDQLASFNGTSTATGAIQALVMKELGIETDPSIEE
ncbi:peptidyl-prolyl cis-trans isomerase [Synoicihabitans lomoniglobus]|uniref:Peptidyl-prolyl cis-trans isomerase n=1 Tax=Synoicihabitans lomoniglobus TaxID=2909285 RepID=A0AAF0I3V2_9BACT|nr:peptidyl-prolyl cis-trans isomerase [Opitutaceae bacterium LMO-M01]WED66135.1 peptidyl-prolyl cis-trans isomerase [Opitutaceae bacterium LMO-M01]